MEADKLTRCGETKTPMQQHGKSARTRKTRLFVTYMIMTLAVTAISAICIALVLGYRFDVEKGDVELGGLVQLRSFPEKATITFDSEKLAFTTPGKRTVAVGPHSVTMSLKDYQTWQKTFSVQAGELRWLNYARLVPTNITTNALKEFPSVTSALPSPDKKWFVVQAAADKPEFTLVDLREKVPVFTTLTLPATSYTTVEGQPHAFSLVEWDFGAKYVLVKHTTGTVTEFIRLDRSNPTAAVNITSKLGVTVQDIHFSGTSGNVYYALQDGTLRRLDSGAGTISQPIQKNVTAFELYKEDTIAYTRTEGLSTVVGLLYNDKLTRVATYPADQPVLVDVSSYFSDTYVVAMRGTKIDTYFNPQSKSESKRLASVTTPQTNSWVHFANSGRFIVAGNGSQFTTHDYETHETYSVNLPGTASDPTKPLQWLDDFYMVSTANNDIRLTEFDGGNQHVIASVVPGTAMTLSDDAKFLYSLTKSHAGGVVFQQSLMTVGD